MATKKKPTTKKVVKKEDNSIVLKLFGAIVNSAGLAWYVLYNILVVIGSFNAVIKFDYNNIYGKDNVIAALDKVAKYSLRETAIILGSVLFFELLNYFLYLKKSKNGLMGMLVIEAIAFVVIGVLINFYYIPIYIMLLPVATGLINYAILSKEGK